jgi:hypothetical protein
MQTTLRIDNEVYRSAKAEAARLGVTLTKFIEDALRAQVARGSSRADERAERDRLMERLLHATAHFRVGPRPTREELHER